MLGDRVEFRLDGLLDLLVGAEDFEVRPAVRGGKKAEVRFVWYNDLCGLV